jgi:hypothetical protein
MSTITLDHLTEPQRQALQGPALATPSELDAMAGRLLAARTRARLFDRPGDARVYDGFARLAGDLAALLREDQTEAHQEQAA